MVGYPLKELFVAYVLSTVALNPSTVCSRLDCLLDNDVISAVVSSGAGDQSVALVPFSSLILQASIMPFLSSASATHSSFAMSLSFIVHVFS